MDVRPDRYVAYYRVSTGKQEQSGLGLDAQRAAVRGYLRDQAPAAEFVEVESGKHSDRPQLTAALAQCKRLKARLVIAKLDRLSRNVAFIATLMDSGVEFVACDNPHASPLTIHILAAVAQYEREMIAARTKAALQAAKARGIRLGNPRIKEARAIALDRLRAESARHDANVLPVIREIQASGVRKLRAIARALTARGIATARGGQWTGVQVSDILRRAPLSQLSQLSQPGISG